MKLVHPDYSFQLEFEEGRAIELIIENPSVFTSFINELLLQLEGEEGRFVLSHEYDVIEVNQKLECIINPFDLDVNKKKIINKLYALIKQEVIMSELMVEMGEAYHKFIEIINKIEGNVDYPLSYRDDIDINNFLKFMDVKLQLDEGSVLEKIVDYTKILHELMRYDIIVLVNIQSYLSHKELEELLKYAFYEEIHFLFIESIDRGNINDNIKKVIIDKDLCEIF